MFECGEHARVIGPRILANDHDELGLVEVVEINRSLADAYGFVERGSARLVAHVRAVRQVIRAELAREELVQEGGFVACATSGVEGGVVGDWKRPSRPRQV